MRILIIEDEVKISKLINRALETEGFAVDTTDNGSSGIELSLVNQYDLIILDIMLPGKNGWQVCRELRNKQLKTPILMLTALDDVDDKIKGLNLGADDYLPKPFHLAELVARIRALIRRNTGNISNIIELYNIILNQDRHEVSREGVKLNLSAKEFALLELFMTNPEKVLTREYITEHIWDMNFDSQSNIIESYIKFLRQKVDRPFEKQLIKTIRGVGYKFSNE